MLHLQPWKHRYEASNLRSIKKELILIDFLPLKSRDIALWQVSHVICIEKQYKSWLIIFLNYINFKKKIMLCMNDLYIFTINVSRWFCEKCSRILKIFDFSSWKCNWPLLKPSQDHLAPAEVSAMVSEVVSEGWCCC